MKPCGTIASRLGYAACALPCPKTTMASFDPKLSQCVGRVVYDGAGNAGKTTNLAVLHSLLPEGRRSALSTPKTTQGRTLFFDHLVLEGGRVAGHGFRCELWTVPGQQVVRRRREFLLWRADVVVFVVDSRPSGVSKASAQLRELFAQFGPRCPPLVVQANWQDAEGALEPEAVAASFGATCGGAGAWGRRLQWPRRARNHGTGNADGCYRSGAGATGGCP